MSRDFLLLVFFMNQFPPSPRVLHLDRFKFFRKFAEIFASQGVPPVSATPVANFSTIFASVVDTGGKFATGVNDTDGKFATGVNAAGGKLPQVSTTPAANLPLVSLTPMANNDTILGCRHRKVNLKPKIYIYLNSTTQRCPNKIIKIFLLEAFFHLPTVSLTPVANLQLRISPRIFKKIRNGPDGIIRGLGETDSRKKPEAKNLVTLSLLIRGFLSFL